MKNGAEVQTILLADDSPANLELIVASLEDDGCELVVAVDGPQALDLAERVRPDLILLDVMMPGIDGFEVCRRLKAQATFADVPVIFMTSLGSPRDKLEGFAAGAVDYLVKPLQLDEVRARVQVHLKLRALQRQLVARNAELRAREFNLAEAQRIAHLGSWEFDLATQRLAWSDEVFRIFEIDPEQFAGSYDAFLAAVHPDDRDKVDSAYMASLEERQPYRIEHRLLFADGRIKHVLERGETSYGADGRALGSFGTVQDISAEKETESRLRQSRDVLRALAARHDEQHEAERREIARKLHEDLAQNLSALRFWLSTLETDNGEAERIATMRQTIDHSINNMRKMVAALRPTVLDMGIASALHWLARDFERGVGLAFAIDIDDDTELDDETTTFLFRAAQELLINVALHAAATTVHLGFSEDGGMCCLSIRDDGRGFNPGAPRDCALGLARLAEQTEHHGGHLALASAPGRGTSVEVRLPMPPRQLRLTDEY